MFNIVENPTIKRLYLAGETITGQKTQCVAFDGTPISLDIEGWKVIAKAPSAEAWGDEPGNYRTYHGAINVLMIEPSGKKLNFKMGDNISYLLNWVKDAESTGNVVSYQWIAAFSDRNTARQAAN